MPKRQRATSAAKATELSVEPAERKKKKKKKKKKRKKDAPLEISSKVPVRRFVPVVGPKRKSRDPRFDSMCGDFNEHVFRSAYNFVDEKRARELQLMRAALGKVKDPEAKRELHAAIDREHSRQVENEKKEKKRKLRQQWRKTEDKLVGKGKQRFFLKKSDERNLGLVDKYLELRASGQLEKAISKRRKKNAAKDKRHMPRGTPRRFAPDPP